MTGRQPPARRTSGTESTANHPSQHSMQTNQLFTCALPHIVLHSDATCGRAGRADVFGGPPQMGSGLLLGLYSLIRSIVERGFRQTNRSHKTHSNTNTYKPQAQKQTTWHNIRTPAAGLRRGLPNKHKTTIDHAIIIQLGHNQPYVCVYIYIYMYMYIYIYVCMYVCVYIYIYITYTTHCAASEARPGKEAAPCPPPRLSASRSLGKLSAILEYAILYYTILYYIIQ